MKILMIGAHQDDNEFRCGGLAAKYVKLGYEVRFLSLCNGCGGHHILPPKEISARRAKESAAVGELLGLQYDIWSDMDDCSIMPTLENRRRLIRYIRAFAPDLIITHRTNDYHADHRATAQLVQDAAYVLTVPNECPDAPFMRHMPVIMFYSDHFQNPPFRADIAVDVTDTIELKYRAADLNVSQVYEWLPFNSMTTVPDDPEERWKWLRGLNENGEEDFEHPHGYLPRFTREADECRDLLIKTYGEERGRAIRYAESFMLSEYGDPLTEELKAKLFPF